MSKEDQLRERLREAEKRAKDLALYMQWAVDMPSENQDNSTPENA